MSFPITSHPVDKYSDMNAVDYSMHPGAAHTRQPLVHQETIFRWPHTNAPNERQLYNCNQYFQEKPNQPRFEFNRYDARYPPYEVGRSRHDYNTLHENQQKLHEFQKNGSVARCFDPRLQGFDVRPPSHPPYKKPTFHEKHDVRPTCDSMPNPHDNGMTLHKLHSQPLDIRSSDQPPSHMHATHLRLNAAAPHSLLNSDEISSVSSNGVNFMPPVISATTTSFPKNESLPTPEQGILDRSSNENNDAMMSEKSEEGEPSENVKLSETTLKEETSHSMSKSLSNTDEKATVDKKDDLHKDFVKHSKSGNSPQTEKVDDSNGAPKEKDLSDGSSSPDNGLPSYTAMIAQAILRKETNKSTLSDIYEYMEKHFPSLEKRGTGWRNCVRHTLSLNDCFIKLHRPENGRSCNWAVHPSYFESFSRGDYRKRRALRKRPRGLQWIDPIMLGGYPFVREHDMHPNADQQQSPFYPYPPNPGMWNPPQQPYPNPNQPSPSHLHHFPQPPLPQHTVMHPSYPPPPPPHPSHAHIHSNHCTNPDCYCQFNKSNFRGGYTP